MCILCKSSAAIRSTSGGIFAFGALNAFSNSFFEIKFLLSSFCTPFSFSMRSATASSLYRLSMYSTRLFTFSLLPFNAFPFPPLTMFALISLSLKFSLIFFRAASTFPILNSDSASLHSPSIQMFRAFLHLLYTSYLSLLRFSLIVSCLLVSSSLIH